MVSVIRGNTFTCTASQVQASSQSFCFQSSWYWNTDLCRLAQEEILKHIMTTDSSISRPAALFKLKTWFAKSPRSKSRSSTRAGSPSPHPGRPGSAQAEGLLLANTRYTQSLQQKQAQYLSVFWIREKICHIYKSLDLNTDTVGKNCEPPWFAVSCTAIFAVGTGFVLPVRVTRQSS